MIKIIQIALIFCLLTAELHAQQNDSITKIKPDKSALKFNLNADGSHYFQATFLNQVWFRFNESNDGTTLFNKSASSTFDIGLRRTRVQFFGQITDRTFYISSSGKIISITQPDIALLAAIEKLLLFFTMLFVNTN